MTVLKRFISNNTALNALVLTSLALAAAACSVTVSDDRGKNESSENNSSEDSDAMAMPAGTNAAAKVTLPAELIATDRNAEVSPNEKSAKHSPSVGDDSKTTKISLECVDNARHDQDAARENDASLVMAEVIIKAELREVVGASGIESKAVASLQHAVRCRDFILSLQNLPIGKPMLLGATIGNQLGAFSGQTKQFTFNGEKMVHLSLKLNPIESGTDAIVDVSFETPSAPIPLPAPVTPSSIQILKLLFTGQDAVTLNQILSRIAPHTRSVQLSRLNDTEHHTTVRYGEVSCIMISKRCELNGRPLVAAVSEPIINALSKSSISLIQDKTTVAVHELVCHRIAIKNDQQSPVNERTMCYGTPGVAPKSKDRYTIQ